MIPRQSDGAQSVSISPVSDLVLDVVQAADPAKVLEAQAKLKVNKAQTEAVQLASAGKGFDASVGRVGDARSMKISSTDDKNDKTVQTYRNFEAMVLQNFVQSMMPKDAEDVYGKGTTGDYWKDMMAEQIAKEISAGGGIGIADHMLKDKTKAGSAQDDLASLGSTNPITADSGNGSVNRLLHQAQMKAFDSILPGDHTTEQK